MFRLVGTTLLIKQDMTWSVTAAAPSTPTSSSGMCALATASRITPRLRARKLIWLVKTGHLTFTLASYWSRTCHVALIPASDWSWQVTWLLHWPLNGVGIDMPCHMTWILASDCFSHSYGNAPIINLPFNWGEKPSKAVTEDGKPYPIIPIYVGYNQLLGNRNSEPPTPVESIEAVVNNISDRMLAHLNKNNKDTNLLFSSLRYLNIVRFRWPYKVTVSH